MKKKKKLFKIGERHTIATADDFEQFAFISTNKCITQCKCRIDIAGYP